MRILHAGIVCSFAGMMLAGCGQKSQTTTSLFSSGGHVNNRDGHGTAEVWGISFDVLETGSHDTGSELSGTVSSNPDETDVRNEIILGDVTIVLEKRHGAWSAYTAGTPHSLQQAAHSARELITKTLHSLSPDEEVVGRFNLSKIGDIERKHRVRYVLRERTGRVSKSTAKVIEDSCNLVDSLYARLSAVAHDGNSIDPARRDVESLIRTTEDALRNLLRKEEN